MTAPLSLDSTIEFIYKASYTLELIGSSQFIHAV